VFAYVNSDIIFDSRIKSAIEILSNNFDQFLGVGRRTNIPPFSLNSGRQFLGFSPEIELRKHSLPDRNTAIDYFIHTKDVFGTIPSFAVGRGSWDNWLIWSSLSRGMPVVDLSEYISAMHIDHDYGLNNIGFSEVWSGQENVENKALCGDVDFNRAHIGFATFKLTAAGIVENKISDFQVIQTERNGFFEEKLCWLKNNIDFCREKKMENFRAIYTRKLLSISPQVHENSQMLINEKDVVILGGGSRAKEINALLSFLGIRVQGYMNINRGYARLDNFLVEKELSSITEETFFVIANSYINESISFLKRIALSRPSGKLNRYLVS
jgi:hypothetical protein